MKRPTIPQPASPTKAAASNRIWLGAAIVLLVLIAYIPAMRAGFIWDDDLLLTDNPLIKAADGWWRVWVAFDSKFYFPVTWTTFWVEWRLFGMDAAGYHVINILLHAAGALLLWRVLTRLKLPGAWFGALLFAIHPINVESVAWISERKNTLSLLFFLGTLLCYWNAEDAGSRKWYWVSVGLFVLGLLSKSTVVMLPVVLLLCAWWRHGRITSDDWIRSGTFFLLALVLGLVTFWCQKQVPTDLGMGHPERGAGPWLGVAMAGWTFWFYVFKVLWPVGLSPMYADPRLNPSSPLSYLPLAVLIGLLVLLWIYRRHWGRAPLFATGYVLIMLFPVIGLAGLLVWGIPPMADHMMYLPMIGIVALVVAPAKQSHGALVVGVALLLAGVTWQQCQIYQNAEAYWKAAIDRTPRPAKAHYNLAALLMQQHRFTEAEEHFAQTVALRPKFVLAYLDWGTMLASQGRLAAAADKFKEGLQFKPHWSQFHYNLALALSGLGRTREAIDELEETVVLSPDNVEARYRLGCLLINEGEAKRAIRTLHMVVRQDPSRAAAHYNLGLLLLGQRQFDEAYRQVAEAARLNPNDPDARGLLNELQRLRDRPKQ